MPPLQDLMEGNIVVPPNLYNALTSPRTATLQRLVEDARDFVPNLMQAAAQQPMGPGMYGLRRSDFTDIPGEEPIAPLVARATDLGMNMVGAPVMTTTPATLGSGAVWRGLRIGASDAPKHAPANTNEFDLVRSIENRIRNNSELAARASEPTEAASNPFVQRSLANAQQRSDARMADIQAGLPENPTADSILSLILRQNP